MASAQIHCDLKFSLGTSTRDLFLLPETSLYDSRSLPFATCTRLFRIIIFTSTVITVLNSFLAMIEQRLSRIYNGESLFCVVHFHFIKRFHGVKYRLTSFRVGIPMRMNLFLYSHGKK